MDALQRGPEISRSGRVQTWVLLVLGAGALFVAAELLSERLYAQGNLEVAKDRVRIDVEDPFAYVPDGWSEYVASHLSTLGDVFVDDPEAVDLVAKELRSLPLFHSVGEPRVIWPDRIEFDVRMRRVVACVKTGGGFLPVSEVGVILPGCFVSPMSDGVCPTPLIAWDESLGNLREGDELSRESHFDALSVALSMQVHLPDEVRVSLGPIRIDASRADLASVTDPGVVLYLTEHRAVLFGRPPLNGNPGELPVENKWGHLVDNLRATFEGGRAWEVLDVRWDAAEVLRWRE